MYYRTGVSHFVCIRVHSYHSADIVESENVLYAL